MFDDDDDDSEPRFSAVDKYYFEEGDGNPVSFSVLPLKFDESSEVACLDSKKVDLQGLADNGLLRVHKEVVAWRVVLNYEQPKISVLSSEGKWIELLKPRKCYEKTVRSILITVQMLHFVRKWPRKRKRSLWDHLCEVFIKFDTKPAEYDLKKHRSIIKLFAEKDQTLMKSKVIPMFTENTSRNIREPVGRTKEPNVVSSSDDEENLDNDSDDDYSGQEDNNDADYSYDDDNSDDQGSSDNKSNDDHSCKDDDRDDDGDIDNDGDGDDDDGGTDNLCAICDNGGKLLSCEGECKRAFHPRKKDGTENNCETLGLTTAQLKEIDHYLCKNCEYKQHQCFNCGDLEPSDGPNAKVFQCYKASCGHFYHPGCIANLLEPDDTDGAYKLEKKIAAGMSFTCPVHWCSKCGKMEDSAQIAQWLAVCRRCPESYHKKCLPSDIPFDGKGGRRIRAWQLDDRIIIYCRRHKIEDTLGTPCRDRTKIPSIAEMDSIGSHCMDRTPSVGEIHRTRELSKEAVKVTGKRKMNADQGSTGTTEMSNKLCSKEADQTQKVAINNSREHIIRKGSDVLRKDTTHLNLVHNDEQDNIIVEKQVEGDKNNRKSGNEGETHKGETACGHDLIFEKEKMPGKESSESGLSIGVFTSGHVDGSPREKLAYVKTTTSNRIGTQQDCECDGDQQVEGSYASKQELKNPQCNDTHKATEIDTSGDNSRMRQEHKEQTTDSRILNLEKNSEKSDMKTGRDAHYKVQGPQCLHHNKKEPDALAHKFRNRDLSSSSTSKGHRRHNDDRRASKTREFKSRDEKGSDREEWRNNMRVDSYRGNSPSERTERRNPPKRSRVCSLEGERRRSDHSSDGDRRRYEYSSDGGGGRRMLCRHEDYRSDGDVGRRRLSPRQSEYLREASYPKRTEHGGGKRHGPPSYGGRHVPYMDSRGSEHVNYAMDRRSAPFDRNPPKVEYDGYPDLRYGRYNAMGMALDDRYSRHEGSTGAYGRPIDAGMGEQATFYAACFRDYREGYGHIGRNRLNSEDRALAAGSVTDRYVPRLDQTNHPIRSQGGLHDSWRHQSL